MPRTLLIAARTALNPTVAPQPAPQDVLYIEDHPVNAQLMQRMVELRPHLKLTIAVDGADAFRVGAGLAPALLLVDLRLPDCRGSELLPLLRLRMDWPHVPAVAVTAESEFRSDGTTFAEVWHKPLDVAHVLARLDHFVPAGSAGAVTPPPVPAVQR